MLNQNLAAKLLWTNPSPGADFIAQTVTLDLSSYSAIDIVACYATVTHRGGVHTRIDVDGGLSFITLSDEYRPVTVSTTSVTFGDGTGGGAIRNNGCVPLKIYGLKY